MMPAFFKNLFFGGLIAILLVATIVFGVLWVRTKNELRITNQEARNLETQFKTLEKKLKEEVRKESEVEPIDTSEWKTYRNEEYGFEVKYPSNLVALPNFRGKEAYQIYTEYIDFWPEEDMKTESSDRGYDPTLSIFFIELRAVKGIKEFAKDWMACVTTRNGIEYSAECEPIPITIGPNQYFHVHEVGHGEGIWHHLVGKGEFIIDFQTYNSNITSGTEFSKILSTFKFIPSTSSGQAD